MCPDKPPSCYPTPTLRESRLERFDCHPRESVGQRRADRCLTASTFSLRLADRNYEDRMSSQKEPAQAVAAHRLHRRERQSDGRGAAGDPAEGPGQAEARQAGMVSLLAGELVALQQRGYTIEEVAESLRGARARHHDADAEELPAARQEQDGEASEERRPDRVQRARQRDAKGGEARGVERARAHRQLRRHQPRSRRRARRRRARRRRLRRSAAARKHFS